MIAHPLSKYYAYSTASAYHFIKNEIDPKSYITVESAQCECGESNSLATETVTIINGMPYRQKVQVIICEKCFENVTNLERI